MAEEKIKFYFAYNRPYSFLGSTRIEKELARYEVEIERKPIYSPRRGSGPDMNSPKMRYMFEDITRFAKAYKLPVNMGPFADTKKACMGFLFANEKGKGKAYHDGVYAARWLEGKNIGDENVLAEIAEKAGLDRNEFLAALNDSRYEAALERSNKDGEADGVFGFPTFIYEGQKFWGNDRIEWLVRAIEGK